MGELAARRRSLDVFRGMTIAAMVIVDNPGNWSTVYAPLLHAEWHGWTPTDFIFPFFVFILGMSLTLASRGVQSVRAIVKRAAIIFACGFLLAYYVRFDLATVRIPGVLFRLAMCSLVASLVYRQVLRAPDDARVHLVLGLAGAVLVGYWALLTFVPPPGGVAGDLTPAGNLGAWLDRAVFGTAHLWRTAKTWDPEGLLSTLPAVGTALTGVAAGLVLKSGRSDVEKLAIYLAVGGAAVAAGLLWDPRFPINKQLWTSSFVLFTSGLAAIAFGICFWLLDVRGRRSPVLHPFVVMGMNPLALFVMSGFLIKTLLWIKIATGPGTTTSLYNWIYTHAFLPLGLWGPRNTSLAFAIASLLVLYVPLEVMYRKRIFWRA